MKISHLFSAVALFFILLTSAQAQQTARIKLDSLDKLAARATKVEQKEEKATGGDGMVYVRHFEFSEAGQYQEADLGEIRAQLQGPGWSRLVKVEDKDDDEKVDVYIFGKPEDRDAQGMTVVVTEPKEVTVVNIVGRVGLEDLKRHGRRTK